MMNTLENPKVSNQHQKIILIQQNNFLLKNNSEYATNTNYIGETFLDYLDISDKLIEVIKTNDKINWNIMLLKKSEIDEDKISLLEKIFHNGTLKLINFIIDIIYKDTNFNLKELNTYPTFELPFNKNLKTKEIISILEKLEKLDKSRVIDILDTQGKTIVYAVIIANNYELLKYLIDKELDMDKYTSVYTWHPFISCYNFETNNSSGKSKYKMSKLIWNNIKDTHNFNSTNKYGENLAYSIMNSRLISSFGDYDLELDILKRNTVWDKINIDKLTIFNVLVNLSFEKYYKVLEKNKKNIKVNVTQRNSNNETILDIAKGKWLEFIKKLPNNKNEKECNKKNENCISLENYKFSNSNTFSSTMLDAGLFVIHFENKYKNLYIPKYIDKVETNMNWENGFEFPDNFLNEYNNFPWVIFWKDKFNYHIHPYLNQLINSNKNDNKYDYSFVLLSVQLPHGGLHAMLLYYDLRNNFIERFDPFGNTHDIDVDIDEILEEELTWNTGFYYLNVKKYLPVAGFQNLSDETNVLNLKPGDFGGYCLAWCLWYLELRIKNYRFTAKELVSKAITKLLNKENSLIEFIRNYANNLDKKRQEQLVKIGIPKNRTTNQKLKPHEDRLIFNYIKDKTTLK
jgi:hypothetical protein